MFSEWIQELWWATQEDFWPTPSRGFLPGGGRHSMERQKDQDGCNTIVMDTSYSTGNSIGQSAWTSYLQCPGNDSQRHAKFKRRPSGLSPVDVLESMYTKWKVTSTCWKGGRDEQRLNVLRGWLFKPCIIVRGSNVIFMGRMVFNSVD